MSREAVRGCGRWTEVRGLAERPDLAQERLALLTVLVAVVTSLVFYALDGPAGWPFGTAGLLCMAAVQWTTKNDGRMTGWRAAAQAMAVVFSFVWVVFLFRDLILRVT